MMGIIYLLVFLLHNDLGTGSVDGNRSGFRNDVIEIIKLVDNVQHVHITIPTM
jgi:hypothetical protein